MSMNQADILMDCILEYLCEEYPVTLSYDQQQELLEWIRELKELAEPLAEEIRIRNKIGEVE